MTVQNLYSASPKDSAITGFIFTDLDSYRGEYDHRHALFGTKNYELQMVDGNQIDQELFAGLKIGQANIDDWFSETQILTFDEKVGLWFLIHESGFSLTDALDAIQDGVTILHGTKKQLAGLSRQRTMPRANNVKPFFHEFRFAGETWVGSPVAF